MKNIETLYPLSPIQQGMLFHSLYSRETDEYFRQFSCVIDSDLNAQAFHNAWQEAVDRHSVLRTSFIWEGVKSPIQVVHQGVNLPWVEQDWRALSSSDQEKQFKAFLQADWAQGLDLSRPPLLRCALFRKSDNSYYFVWSCHHIILDGWSISLLL